MTRRADFGIGSAASAGVRRSAAYDTVLRNFAVLLAAAAGLCLGCRSSNEAVVPVRGQVTFNGLPADAELAFVAERSAQTAHTPAVIVQTNERGEFDIGRRSRSGGLPTGIFRVDIRVRRVFPPSGVQDSATSTEPAPANSPPGDLKTVRLTRSVEAPETVFRFALRD